MSIYISSCEIDSYVQVNASSVKEEESTLATTGIAQITYFCQCESGIYENALKFRMTAVGADGKKFDRTFDLNKDQQNKITARELRDIVSTAFGSAGFNTIVPPEPDKDENDADKKFGSFFLTNVKSIDGQFINACMQLEILYSVSPDVNTEQFYPGQDRVKKQVFFGVDSSISLYLRGGLLKFVTVSLIPSASGSFPRKLTEIEIGFPGGCTSEQIIDLLELELTTRGFTLFRDTDSSLTLISDDNGNSIVSLLFSHEPEPITGSKEACSPHWILGFSGAE